MTCIPRAASELQAGTNCWWEPNQRRGIWSWFKSHLHDSAGRVTECWRQKGRIGARERGPKCEGEDTVGWGSSNGDKRREEKHLARMGYLLGR